MLNTYRRTLGPPKGSFFLLGPRGTGKSTWLREHFTQAASVNLLDEGLYQTYLAHPNVFYDEMRALDPGTWVAIDEIQRLPPLLNTVHRLIEERKMKFAMTGSSARKLRRGGVNLLAGRAIVKEMFPLTPMEVGDDFDLKRAMQFGTLPLVWQSESPQETLASYVQLYLKEEIQAEALARNLAGFARFVSVAALFHGQTLNVSALARDAEVQRPTVQGFVDILVDTLVARRLPAYSSKLRVREKKHPKLYWIDPGIVRAARNSHGTPEPEERGALLEGFVFMLLEHYRSTVGAFDELFYWQPADAQYTEVDFLLRRGKEFIAVEVKANERFKPEYAKGLKAIADLPGLRRRILVYTGKRILNHADGIDVLPLRAFCDELTRQRL